MGLGVDVVVGDGLAVGVGEALAVAEGVGDAVTVGVSVAVGDALAADVAVAVALAVTVAERVGVTEPAGLSCAICGKNSRMAPGRLAARAPRGARRLKAKSIASSQRRMDGLRSGLAAAWRGRTAIILAFAPGC